MYRILIVEDDPGIASAIAERAGVWELEPHVIEDFHDVLSEFRAFAPHLVIMDIALPFFNGYHWCRKIRAESQTPILFLSSAADNLNMIMAMDMGADDFLAKPFDLELLFAKMNALLRRSYDFTAAPNLEHRGLRLSAADGSVSVNGVSLELSKNEYRILLVLLQNRDKIVSREKLMQALWETDSFVDENTISVNVGRLRRKLSSAGLEDVIRTKFGVGYYLA